MFKWHYLNRQEHLQLELIVAFLEHRMTESETITWALSLKSDDHISRTAINYLVHREFTDKIIEPWSTAWRLIEESWNENKITGSTSSSIYDISSRLKHGEISGKLILDIAEHLSPRLIVKKHEQENTIKYNKKPKTYEQLLHASVSSEELPNLEHICLDEINDISFLISLSRCLESNIDRGLDIVRRICFTKNISHWVSGIPSRVYYTSQNIGDDDPDQYKNGLSPSIKVLFQIIKRLAELSSHDACKIIHKWSLHGDPIYTRLWAAAARDSNIVENEVVSDFLINLNNDQFWGLYDYPEISELRAVRFNDLSKKAQKKITTRIRNMPPKSQWPKSTTTQDLANFRLYSTLQELQRIKFSGGNFPERDQVWIDSQIGAFKDLKKINLTSGFPEGIQVTRSHQSTISDGKYNELDGITRLNTLEAAFITHSHFGEDSPADGARNWLREQGHLPLIINDLMKTNDGGSDFPYIWEQIGWNYSPNNTIELLGGIDKVLFLLSNIKDSTLKKSINGICELLYILRIEISQLPFDSVVWRKVWPIAVANTNNTKSNQNPEVILNITPEKNSHINVAQEIDTLNPPVGKLISVFLEMSPSKLRNQSGEVNFNKVRDLIITANGKSSLIVKCRLIANLPYFLHVDKIWTQQHLITPLQNNDTASFSLWQELAKQTQFTEVIKIIGNEMISKALEGRIDRKTREGLVFSLIAESLHAFREERMPAIANIQIQQMLRMVDDELRVKAALVVQRFVRELSSKPDVSAAELFNISAKPFLREVWPQERSLVTPSISESFANLPATSKESFTEAVSSIERFLIPFECWALLNYGLHGKHNISIIDDSKKAKSLLKLLDLTVGNSELAIIPHDLTNALDRIREIAPKLLENPIYRRLSTAARR